MPCGRLRAGRRLFFPSSFILSGGFFGEGGGDAVFLVLVLLCVSVCCLLLVCLFVYLFMYVFF